MCVRKTSTDNVKIVSGGKTLFREMIDCKSN